MSRLCLITALPAETRPLLDRLKLRQAREKHLRLYESERYLLLETGLGKLRSAAATAALLQSRQDIGCVINIGIAGGCFAYGQLIAAHQVSDAASGAQWYPHLPSTSVFREMPSASVSTVDKPCANYQRGILFDMEAAGIFSAASTYLSTSQIHSIKLISDNPENAIQGINKSQINALLQDAMYNITQVLEALHEHACIQGPLHDSTLETFIEEICSSVHHTINDEQQLRALLQRHLNLSDQLPTLPSDARNAKEIRQTLNNKLTALPFNYGSH